MLRLALGFRALSLRLRLRGLVEQSSLPALLDALSRGDIEPAPQDAVEEALARADALTAALPFVPQTCLYRSLARYALLRRAGHRPRFVMAVDPPREARSELEGHAWVEIDGTPFGEEVDERLVVTYAYPPRA